MCLPHNVTLTRIAHGHADRICAAGQPRRGGRAQRRARRAPGSRARPRGPRAPPRRRRGFGVVPAAARGRGRRGCGTGEGITERGTMVPQSDAIARFAPPRPGPWTASPPRRDADGPRRRARCPEPRTRGRCGLCRMRNRPRRVSVRASGSAETARGPRHCTRAPARRALLLSVLYRTRVLSVKLSSTYAGVIRGTMLTLLRTSRRVAVGRTARKPPQYAPISLTIDELLTRAEARAHRTAPHAPWPSRVSLSIAGFCLSLSWRRLTAGSCKLSSQLRHLRAQLDLPCGGLARLPLTLSIHFLDGLAHSSLHLERIGAVEVDNPTAMMRGKQGTRSVRAPLQAPR